ncbi:Subtilase family protein [Tenacibaculum sp. MAR_2009_124]|uniref:S8 family peptidase n=1 Tax=Tenacibaculum sp. MAR_2009_124 TaxID=1250059 RepID=UPI000898320C|nr:S8 family serine peptidase [Tenacibaculum sp. MAR_2009_124]SEB40634.1 Subtilase family protein [Tenacibaculum sp. MAR_2009_124]
MKFIKLLLVLLVVCINYQCSENKDTIELQQQKKITKPKVRQNVPRYSRNELIIKYKPNLSRRDKQNLRNQYGVETYEQCDLCDDDLIEKWNFGSGLNSNINIEDKKLSIQGGSGGPEGDITDVDYEFSFRLEGEYDSYSSGEGYGSYSDQIVGSNEGVTIAVLDTGIDANYPLFPDAFLFNSSGIDVEGETSGWNFVGHNSNFFDDYNLIHGTKVSYIINKKLREEGIPHQILPVKVCDENGVATYFNILCGLKYALPRANIVQISLGWYETNTEVNTIFSSLVAHYQKKVLVVTSAGNSAKNTDDIVHYPSCYPQRNILSIASSNADNSNIASFSNFGLNTVDFYAPGEDIAFYDISMIFVPISGTSYSAPLVSALSAKILYNSGMLYSPNDIISQLTVDGITISYDVSKPVKYNKLLN